jgi:hypothetical protein
VVAALGASALTGAFGFGAIWWQERKRIRTADLDEKGAAYRGLIARSFSFATRAQVLRTLMQTRSGLKEGLDVAMRIRRPLDPMELHDWIAQDFAALNDAWSAVEIVGSADAVRHSNILLDCCADLLTEATQIGEARGQIATGLKGVAWTTEQEQALIEARDKVFKARRAFIRVARMELGSEVVGDVAEHLAATSETSRS